MSTCVCVFEKNDGKENKRLHFISVILTLKPTLVISEYFLAHVGIPCTFLCLCYGYCIQNCVSHAQNPQMFIV